MQSFVARPCATFLFIIFSVLATLAQELRLLSPHFAGRRAIPSGFEQINSQQGLSDNYVYTIIQDRHGRLWLGSSSGLNIYDGYSFVVLRHDPANPDSIPPSQISHLLEDKDGYIWLATTSAGVARIDPRTRKAITYRYNPDSPRSIKEKRILKIIQDHKRRIWIVTDYALYLYHPETDDFTVNVKSSNYSQEDRTNFVFADVAEDINGKLILATTAGILLYHPETQKIERYDIPLPNTPGEYKRGVTRIYIDSQARIWLGTWRLSLMQFYRNGSFSRSYFFTPPEEMDYSITDLFCREDGLLWVATFGSGLILFDPETEKYIHYLNDPLKANSLSSNFVRSLLIDRNGILWIGTEVSGLNKYSEYKNKFKLYRSDPFNVNSLSHNMVRGILLDSQGLLWVATQEGGLNSYDREQDVWKHYRHNPKDSTSISSDSVNCVYEDSKGRIWIGTNATNPSGFLLLDRKTGRFKNFMKHNYKDISSLPPTNASAILEDEDGTFWITNDGGLKHFDPETETFTTYNFFSENIFRVTGSFTGEVLYKDRSGVLWVGSAYKGLNIFDTKKKKFVQTFSYSAHDPESLSHDYVTSITEDRRGRLLVTTKGGGLNICTDRVKGTFRRFTVKDGLSHNNVYSCLEDESGNLWLSTDGGLCRLNLDTGETHTFTVDDGLQSDEFNRYAYYKSRSGELFFGGVNGLNSFYTENIRLNPHPPKILFTGLRKFNNPVQLIPDISEIDELSLNYDDIFFSIEFAALDFTSPMLNTFEYKLEGFNQDWIKVHATQRLATFTNLKPGKYLFRVRSCNADGICNTTGKTLKILVIPPWWMTWWAYSLFFLSVVVTIYTGVRWRLSALRRTNRALEQKVFERTAELVKSRNEIEEQRTKILDSIYYAEQIQKSLLPSITEIESAFTEYFLIYKPKDIVSGDFYWLHRFEHHTVVAVLDCTGHGVPGALMSIIGDALLNRIVVENRVIDPAEILHRMNESVRKMLKQEEVNASQDGMDIAICTFNTTLRECWFAGAHIFLCYSDGNGKIVEIKGNRKAIGGPQRGTHSYNSHRIQITPTTRIYLTTDGFLDQSGAIGKFGKKRLYRVLENSLGESMQSQCERLQQALREHQGDEPQRDDITLIGIRL